MEGKALLFKHFGGVDAVPIAWTAPTWTRLVETVVRLAPGLRRHQPGGHHGPALLRGGAPAQERLDIPVFHDDQHGTAIVVLAALRGAAPAHRARACPTCGWSMQRCGGGRHRGLPRGDAARGGGRRPRRDRRLPSGMVHTGREDLNAVKSEFAAASNRAGLTGSLLDALAVPTSSSACRAARVPAEAVAPMAAGRDDLGDGQPEPGGHPDVAHKLRRRRGHRPHGLPQPDQQRAGLPWGLRGSPASRALHHRGDEAGRGRGPRGRGRRTTSRRTR